MTDHSKAPLFIVGTGRCGSTIVYSALAAHRNLAWLPSWVDAFPRFPILSAVNRLWALPGSDRFRDTRFFPKPVEPNEAFSHYVDGFGTEEVNALEMREARERLVPFVDRLRRHQGATRFMAKLVGRPVKIDLLSEVYPESTFVHITRALKPTVSSVLKVDFYSGWGSLEDWPWESIPPQYLEFYEQTGRSEEVGVAIGIKLNRLAIAEQLSRVQPERKMELAYHEFVQNPIDQVRRIADFAGIPIDDRFIGRVRARNIFGGADEKWKQSFSEAQVRNLDEFEALAGW